MKKVFTPQKKQSFSRGFTFIELLVVIGIIGILAGLVFTTINSVRANARDAKRIFELTQFKNILELYNFDNDSYPLSTPGYEIPDASWGGPWPGYTPIVPEDPLSAQTYAYVSDGTNYQVYAKLERMSDTTFSCGGCGPDDCSYNAFFANPGVSVDDFAGYRTVYIDEDGDGFGAGIPDDICNIGAIPPGWALNGTDCDDDPITGGDVWDLNTCYADADGDGVCISSSVQLCTDGSCPAGYCSSPGTDCDDDPITGGSISSPISYFIDDDGDTFCGSSTAQLCESSPPAGYCSSSSDCDDDPITGPNIWQYLTCYQGEECIQSSECTGATCEAGGYNTTGPGDTLNLQVGTGADDANESINVRSDNPTIYFGRGFFNGSAGMCYTNVTIPAGSTIDTATSTIHPIAADDPIGTIYMNDVDDAADFLSEVDVYGRARTTANTAWDETNIGSSPYTTPDFKSAVQEVVDRAGWASGQTMCVLFIGPGSGSLKELGFAAYEHSSADPAKLDITYHCE